MGDGKDGQMPVTVRPEETADWRADAEKKLSGLPSDVRQAATKMIGAIRTPFPVNQDTYFEGKKGLNGVKDSPG